MNEDENSQEPSDEIADSAIQPKPDENSGTAPSRSRRPSFGGIRRQLTDTELASPAVQKLLLDILEDTEADKDEYKGYVDAYHAADKRAAVLGEKLNTNRAVDIFFGIGVGLGGTIIGLATFFWGNDKLYGILCLVVGFLMITGAIVGKIVKK